MLLLLATKALIAPVLLALAAIAEHRWGAAVGGWVLGLPLTSGPASFFLLAEHGPRFAENAARGTLLGLVGAGVFVAGYSLAAQGRSWLRSLLLAGLACASVTFTLSQVTLGLGTTLVFSGVVLGIVAVVAAAPKRVAATPAASPTTSRGGLAFRMLVASAVVLGVSLASTVLGSVASGMLATVPAITALMAVSTHRSAGKDSARRMLRGSVAGMCGGAAFFAVVALLVMSATPGITYLAAAGAAAVVATVSGQVTAQAARASAMTRPTSARPAQTA
jgi:hypothetical protein